MKHKFVFFLLAWLILQQFWLAVFITIVADLCE